MSDIVEQKNERLTKFALALIANDMDAELAARAVGIKKNISKWASQAIKTTIVEDIVMKYRMHAMVELGVSIPDLVRKYAQIASAEVTDYFDDDGNILPMKDWKNKQAVFSYSTRIGRFGREVKITMHPKIKALEALSQHIGFFTAHNASKTPMVVNLKELKIEDLKQVINILNLEK